MKHYLMMTIFALLAVGFFMAACGEQKPATEKVKVENLATTPEDIKKEAQDLAKTTITYAEEQKEIYTQQVLDRLAQYNQKLIQMDRKLAMLNEQAKAGLAVELDNFSRKKEEVAVKVRHLQAASGEAYEDLKEGMNKAIEDMDKAYDQAMSRFEN